MNEVRAFNLTHAKDGAPVVTRDGRKARVMIFSPDIKEFSLIGIVAALTPGKECSMTWTSEGKSIPGFDSLNDLQMAPLGMLDGRPVFTSDRLEELSRGDWQPVFVRASWRGFINCRWPQGDAE